MSKKVSGLGKVLLIDDEQIILHATSKMLVNLGYEPEAINSYLGAIDLYKNAYENQDSFDVVIMDLVIPDQIDALEAVKRIKKIDKNAHIILSTGFSEDPIIDNHKKNGFASVIKKPYGIRDLDNILNNVINR
jgi:DNA-binding NtrC family response regulator